MGNQSVNSFGIFSGSSGGGGGGGTVTSIAAGTGIVCTPDPITATGSVSLASVNGLQTTFVSSGGTSGALIPPTAGVPIYSPTTYPPTNFTLTQNGRATIATTSQGAGALQSFRIGTGGLSMFDEISFSAQVFTTCNSGVLVFAPTGNGIFSNRPAVSVPTIVCDGSNQTANITMTTFRVGDDGQGATDVGTDFIQTTYATSATGGNVGYNSMSMTITQYSS